MEKRQLNNDDQITSVRAFNRFYTKQIGLLNEGLLKSKFTLTEARVLYELGQAEGLTATNIKAELGLDAGYLSRLLKKFEKMGLIIRSNSSDDARQTLISLSSAGRAEFEPLNTASYNEISVILNSLPEDERDRLVESMTAIQSILRNSIKPDKTYTLRPLQVGDIGWITHRQGLLYQQEYGWDESFEVLVAEILADFVKSYDEDHDHCWIAELDGKIVGSVFVVRKSTEVAKLRLLYVEASARGLGIGKRLVDECIDFSRRKGYKKLTLWTNDVLKAALHLYQSSGFKLISEDKHHSFGKDLIGQTWDLDL